MQQDEICGLTATAERIERHSAHHYAAAGINFSGREVLLAAASQHKLRTLTDPTPTSLKAPTSQAAAACNSTTYTTAPSRRYDYGPILEGCSS